MIQDSFQFILIIYQLDLKSKGYYYLQFQLIQVFLTNNINLLFTSPFNNLHSDLTGTSSSPFTIVKSKPLISHKPSLFNLAFDSASANNA